MRLPKVFAVQLLWIILLINPAVAQVQQQSTVSDTANAIPADTVLPGQKKPFTDAQRLEADNKRFLTRAVLPASMLIGAGIYTIQGNGLYSSFDARDARNNALPNFSTTADDFIMIAPLVGLYGFNLISSQNRHELPRQTALLAASGVVASALVWPTKRITNIDRPNGDPWAFPSGHTAYAFTIATFMDKEFRHKSPWVSVVSYGVAGATGTLRILNNEHWMADVLAGAGVGILSVNAVYWVHAKLVNHRAIKDRGLNTAVAPVVLPTGQPGMGMRIQF